MSVLCGRDEKRVYRVSEYCTVTSQRLDILAHGDRYAAPAFDSIPSSRVPPLFYGHDSAGPAVAVSFREL